MTKIMRNLALAISACAMCVISSAGFAGFMAVDDSYTTPENTELVVSAPGVLSNDTTDGFVLSITSFLSTSSPPPEGTLSLNTDGSFIYTPAPNFTGIDTFSYFDLGQNVTVANMQTSNTAAVSIDVTPGAPLPTTTPLPATLPLFAGGLGLVGFLTKRRKSAKQALAA
jgi:hypothetical protein